MILKELEIYNFGVFEGSHEIKFSPPHGKSNIILIGGMNGGGKTTVLEAVLLALYGKRSFAFLESGLSYTEYLKKYINENSSTPVASLTLKIKIPLEGDLEELKIIRSWSGKGKRISDELQVIRNGLFDKDLSQNWDMFIEDILPSGIAGLFFFDGEKILRLAEEKTREEMKESIESLLGLDIIDRLLADLKRVVKKKQKKITHGKQQQEIDELQKQHDELEKNFQRKKQERAYLTTSLYRYKEKLREKENELLKRGGTFYTSKNELEKEKNQLVEQLGEKKAELINLASSSLPLFLVKDLLKKIHLKAKKEKEAQKADLINPYLSKISYKISKKAEECGMPPQTKNELIRIIEEEKENNKIEFFHSPLELSPVANQNLENILKNSQIVEKAKNTINEYKQLQEKIANKNQYLNIEVNEEEIQKIINEVNSLNQHLSYSRNQINSLDDELFKIEKEKASIARQLKEKLEKEMELEDANEEAKRIVSYALKSQDILEKFKDEVTLKKVAKLGNQIKDCFNFLTHKDNFVSDLKIDPDSYKLTLYKNNGKEIMKSQLSAGERQMLAISILWGLAQSSGKKIPIIIDTPLGRLDSSHRKNFLIKYLPNASHQVVLLSTDEEVRDHYLRIMDEFINKKYLLDYDDDKGATSIVEGYFKEAVS